MLPAAGRKYLLEGLAATPVVIDRLLASAGEADFDVRPDPERFTTREMLAHMADWEPIWIERFNRLLTEDDALLPNQDPDEVAARNRYSEQQVDGIALRFREGRQRLLKLLRGLSDQAWDRSGTHGEWGPITVEQLAVLILGHDGYHTRQLSEWLVFGHRA